MSGHVPTCGFPVALSRNRGAKNKNRKFSAIPWLLEFWYFLGHLLLSAFQSPQSAEVCLGFGAAVSGETGWSVLPPFYLELERSVLFQAVNFMTPF